VGADVVAKLRAQRLKKAAELVEDHAGRDYHGFPGSTGGGFSPITRSSRGRNVLPCRPQ
jgi:hypothetical protein